MPLAFESLSHGTVAFGFFNIDSDMLLLENHFFFADDFCRRIGELARSPANEGFSALGTAWTIAREEDVGDLSGAIHGVRFTGFIGETYRRYPFPAREEDFRQKPEGFETQEEFREMIAPFAEQIELRWTTDPKRGEATIGGFRFDAENFRKLVDYVLRGGWPRWRNEERPPYVLEMKANLTKTHHPLLEHLLKL